MYKKILRFFILIFLHLLSNSSFAYYSADFAESPPKFSFDDLKKLINSLPEKRIDKLIEALPESYKKNYSIMLYSKSLQEAEPQYPRVLIFGEDAKLVISFNGHPKQRGYESLETMRYVENENGPKFIFEEIVFEDDLMEKELYLKASGRLTEINQLRLRHGQTGPNPIVCLSCHKQDARPNWDPYSMWPGAFAQFDKIFAKLDGVMTKEYQDAMAFINSAKSHPRYTQLPAAKGLIDRYLNPNHDYYLDCLSNNEVKNCTIELFEVERPSGFNETFTRLLEILNKRRIVHRITNHKKYDEFKKALLASLLYCPIEKILEYVPENEKTKLTNIQAKEFSQQILIAQKQELNKQVEQAFSFIDVEHLKSGKKILQFSLTQNVGNDGEIPSTLQSNMGGFLYLVEKGMGIDASQFSMTLNNGTYLFSNSAFGSFVEELGKDLNIQWPQNYEPCNPKILDQIQ